MKPSDRLAPHRAAIRHELGQLLGVPVDVLTPNALPAHFRAAVLAQVQAV